MTTRIPRRLLGATVTIASSALALVLPSGAFGQGGTIPPLQKVDTNGTQIEGASWQFESCTRYNNEPDWTCIQGSDYGPLPKIGWTDWIGREIDTEGGGGPNLIQVITVWETEAPAGYALDSTPVSYTAGCNGWRRGVPPADYPGRDRSPRWEGQPTVDCDSDPMGPDEPMRLVNEPIMVPVLQNQMPLLQKLDQDNRPLLGAVATGHSCTRWDSDLNWQCQSLDDYPAIDPQANSTFLRDDIASRFPTTPTTPLLGLTSHRLIMWEKSAPAGYSTTPRTYAVEYACGAWRTLEVSGRSADDLTGASTATCDSPVLADNTFTWVNARIPTTTVPQTSGAQGTPVASVPAGAPVTSTPATVTTPPPMSCQAAAGRLSSQRVRPSTLTPRQPVASRVTGIGPRGAAADDRGQAQDPSDHTNHTSRSHRAGRRQTPGLGCAAPPPSCAGSRLPARPCAPAQRASPREPPRAPTSLHEPPRRDQKKLRMSPTVTRAMSTSSASMP